MLVTLLLRPEPKLELRGVAPPPPLLLLPLRLPVERSCLLGIHQFCALSAAAVRLVD